MPIHNGGENRSQIFVVASTRLSHRAVPVFPTIDDLHPSLLEIADVDERYSYADIDKRGKM